MPLIHKTWENNPGSGTNLSAEALMDMEDRLGAYADSVGAGGILLDAAKITSNVTTTSTTNVVVSGSTLTVTVATRPIILHLNGDLATCSAALGGGFYLYQDGVQTGAIGAVLTGANEYSRFGGERHLTPSAGSHTYTLQCHTNTGANALTVIAGDGTAGNNSPILFWCEAV